MNLGVNVSLQSALITIGIILIFVIYIVSVMLEKRKSSSRQMKQGQSGLNDKDEPSLMDLDLKDDVVDEDADEIPILERPLMEERVEATREYAAYESESVDHQVNPFERESSRSSYDHGLDMPETVEPKIQGSGSGTGENQGNPYEIDSSPAGLQGRDVTQSVDHSSRVNTLLGSEKDDLEVEALEILEDLVLPEAKSNRDSSAVSPEELEDFESEIDSLLEYLPDSDLDLPKPIEEPAVTTDVSGEGIDASDMTIQTGQHNISGHGLEDPDLKVQNQELQDQGSSEEVDTEVVVDLPQGDIDSKGDPTGDPAGYEVADSQPSMDMDDEQHIDSYVEQEQVEDIPVLEVSSQVQERDIEEDNSLSMDAKRESDKAQVVVENQKVTSYRDKRVDDGNHVRGAGETTFTKPGGKIEPTLHQIEEVEKDQLPPISGTPGSSSEFTYPKIQGFEKISQIDYWVKIHGDRDVGRESVLAQFNESKASLSKISRIHGIKIPQKNWCDLEEESEDARFGDLIVTIQLADQKGSVNADELNKFSRLVENLSEGTGRSYTFMAPIESALQQAQAISDFVRYYDSIFVINIKPEQSEYFEGGLINRCATQLGLDKCDKQYYVRNKIMGKRKICLYSLANMSESGKFDFDNIKNLKTRGVTFFTKPAANRSPGAVFSEMVDTAKAFAGRIKGQAIAPNHEDLSQEVVDQIRQSIEKVAEDMEEHGMTPGSDEAMRIF
jgi:FtsZ-interacting cell division protein ZipA